MLLVTRSDGIEHADSFILDPHKWLFAPFDCAALVYRDPEIGREAHTQHAGYLEPVQLDGEWNPSDFSYQLSRRARGLPFWFSLAVHGTDAYAAAIERTLEVARFATEQIRAREHLELLHEPELSVVRDHRGGQRGMSACVAVIIAAVVDNHRDAAVCAAWLKGAACALPQFERRQSVGC